MNKLLLYTLLKKLYRVKRSVRPVQNTMDSDRGIRTLFTSAKTQRTELEASTDLTSTSYQENLQAAIASLEECRKIADHISLFSPNEIEDDISSWDLQ